MMPFAFGLVIGYFATTVLAYLKHQPIIQDLRDAWEDAEFKDPYDEWMEHLLSLKMQQACKIKEKKPVEIELKIIKKPTVKSQGWDWVYHLLPGRPVVPVGESKH